jgi:hypothetical protein
MYWKKPLARLKPSPALGVAIAALVLASVGSAAAVDASITPRGNARAGKHASKHRKAPAACIASQRRLCPTLQKAVDGEIAGYVAAHKGVLQGSPGPAGAAGAAGPTGATGSSGTANAYTDAHPPVGEGVTLSEPSTVVSTLDLPVGRYVVQADVHVERLTNEGPVTCKLVGPATLDQGVVDIGNGGGEVSTADLALSGPLTLSATGSVRVACTPEVGGSAQARATMTAVQVANLTSTTN